MAQESQPATLLPDETETLRMKRWSDLRYGLFIHYNINTIVGTEQVPNPPPATTFAPPAVDVDAWVKLAKDAGMKYAVLTTRHSAGFCLWDSKVMWHGKEFEYDVAASGNRTDLVKSFMDSCSKFNISPGFYYCLLEGYANSVPLQDQWQRHMMPDDAFELAKAQLSELATRYPDCHYFWIDIPGTASVAQQAAFYDLLRRKNPENIVLLNGHQAAGAKTDDHELLERQRSLFYASDILNTEVGAGGIPLGMVSKTQQWNGKKLFVGYEHCDIAGQNWFNTQNPKKADEIFDVYQRTRKAGGNLLLDIGPPRDGVIPSVFRDTLLQVKEKIDGFEKSAEMNKPQ